MCLDLRERRWRVVRNGKVLGEYRDKPRAIRERLAQTVQGALWGITGPVRVEEVLR